MDKVALIDMDGTIAEYDGTMQLELERLASPAEAVELARFGPYGPYDVDPPWLEARRDLIKRQPGFWRNLPRIEAGFRVVDLLKEVGFSLTVLTKGPYRTTSAWTEKVEWCREHLPDTPVTICEHKGGTYGRILFDDWPSFMTQWLIWRPRGLGIMLKTQWNQDFEHPQVVKVDPCDLEASLKAIRPRVQEAFDR